MRACISKSGHEHAHVEEQTSMRKFRGRLFTRRAHRCVPLRNARELCSRCAALFTRWLAARSYVFERLCVLRIAVHSSCKSISTYTHLISTNPELSERNVSRQTRLLRQLLSDRNYHRLSFHQWGKEESWMKHRRKTDRETTFRWHFPILPFRQISSTPICGLAFSYHRQSPNDRLNIAHGKLKRHPRPRRGVTRPESKWYRG